MKRKQKSNKRKTIKRHIRGNKEAKEEEKSVSIWMQNEERIKRENQKKRSKKRIKENNEVTRKERKERQKRVRN